MAILAMMCSRFLLLLERVGESAQALEIRFRHARGVYKSMKQLESQYSPCCWLLRWGENVSC